jgi:elongator complex protein 2
MTISGIVLATSQTDRKIQLFTSPYPNSTVSLTFTMKVALEGHEDWIRCLDFGRFARLGGGQAQEAGKEGLEEDLVLASGGQDNYIRLWRITQLPPSAPESIVSPHSDGEESKAKLGEGKDLDDDLLDEFERKITGETGRQLSTKAHLISVGEEKEE